MTTAPKVWSNVGTETGPLMFSLCVPSSGSSPNEGEPFSEPKQDGEPLRFFHFAVPAGFITEDLEKVRANELFEPLIAQPQNMNRFPKVVVDRTVLSSGVVKKEDKKNLYIGQKCCVAKVSGDRRARLLVYKYPGKERLTTNMIRSVLPEDMMVFSLTKGDILLLSQEQGAIRDLFYVNVTGDAGRRLQEDKAAYGRTTRRGGLPRGAPPTTSWSRKIFLDRFRREEVDRKFHKTPWHRNLSAAREDSTYLFGDLPPSSSTVVEDEGGRSPPSSRGGPPLRRNLQSAGGGGGGLGDEKPPRYIENAYELEDLLTLADWTYLTIQRGERYNVFGDKFYDLSTLSVSGGLSKEYDEIFNKGYQLMMQVNVPRQFWIPNSMAQPNYDNFIKIKRKRPSLNPFRVNVAAYIDDLIQSTVNWDGNGLAYPLRTGFRRRFQVGVRPVSDQCHRVM